MQSRILFLIHNLAGGGAQRVVTLWAEILSKQNYQVTVLTYYPLPNEYPLDPQIKRVNLFATFDGYDQIPQKSMARKKRLERYLAANPQDLVLPFVTDANLLATFCDQTQIKCVTPNLRNSPWEKEKGVDLVLRDWAIQKQGSVILQNHEQTTYFNRPEFAHVRKYIVHNPLHPAIANIEKASYGPIKKIVAVGRLVPQKNHTLIIEAVRILRDEFHENYQLDIYGTGELQTNLQAQIDEAQLNDQVQLCGRCNDIFPVLINYDLFLMTSHY